MEINDWGRWLEIDDDQWQITINGNYKKNITILLSIDSLRSKRFRGVSGLISMFWSRKKLGREQKKEKLFLFLLSPQFSRDQNIEISAETLRKRLLRRLVPSIGHWFYWLMVVDYH